MKPRRNLSARRALVAVSAICLAATGLAALPAGGVAAVDLTLEIAMKADNETVAQAAASKEGAELVGELPPGRNIYLLTTTITVNQKDLAKKSREFLDRIERTEGVSWAIPFDENVGDTRFYAWSESEQSRSSSGERIENRIDVAEALALATGEGVTVALIDTGFDIDHPLLEHRLLPGIDLVDGHSNIGDWKNGLDDDGDGRVDESHGHGTFVAGIIAQVAPDASILPIRAMEADGVGDMHVVIDAIDEAVMRGADIINISFGTSEKSRGLERAIKRAQAAGIVVVAAAGNHGSDEKRYPAALSGVIAVGAYDSAVDGIATWGAYGDWIDVSAPGLDIVSAKPGGSMATWSGSSISAPVVAAQVALMMQIDSKRVSKEAEKLVRESARKSSGNLRSKEGLVQLAIALQKLVKKPKGNKKP